MDPPADRLHFSELPEPQLMPKWIFSVQIEYRLNSEFPLEQLTNYSAIEIPEALKRGPFLSPTKLGKLHYTYQGISVRDPACGACRE